MRFLVILLLFLIRVGYKKHEQKLFSFLGDSYQPTPFHKCYDEIGCVEVTEQWYHHQFRPVNLEPLARHLIKTDFMAIKFNDSDENKVYFDKISVKNDSQDLKSFGKSGDASLFILIHDFTSSGYTGWIKHLSRELLKKSPSSQIIVIDWQKGAEPPLDQAVANARVVALETIYLLKLLPDRAANLHIIGHGVGAHIAGYIGDCIKNIKKISGLDPTGPRFEGMPDVVRLSRKSAKYVEVLHTDASNPRSQGSLYSFGHVDFYINNAGIQPGCVEFKNHSDLVSLDRDALENGQILLGCSHKRAFKYFIEAISSDVCVFLGILCGCAENFDKGLCVSCERSKEPHACSTFGLKSYKNITHHSSYFLNTYFESPFCMNAYSVSVQIEEQSPVTGFFEMILVDDKNLVVNVSLVDPVSTAREFQPAGRNTFLYYGRPPPVSEIKEARVKWNLGGNIFCKLIYCKKSIHVKEIQVKLITTKKTHVTKLCPNGSTELQSAEFASFKRCGKGGKDNNKQ